MAALQFDASFGAKIRILLNTLFDQQVKRGMFDRVGNQVLKDAPH